MICEILTDYGFLGFQNLRHHLTVMLVQVRHQKRSGQRGAMRGFGTALEAVQDVQDVQDVHDCDGLGSANASFH